VRAYKGDAMTLLALDLTENLLENFTGFSIRVTPPKKKAYYLINSFCYTPATLTASSIDPQQVKVNTMEYALLQKFRWVHTPGTNHNYNDQIYGNYTYEITPRYMINNVLQPLNKSLTLTFNFTIEPYKSGNLQVGFTRGFIESQAFSRHFGLHFAKRPSAQDLVFNITKNAGPVAKDKKKNPLLAAYTYEDQQKWIGCQARNLVFDFFKDVLVGKTRDFVPLTPFLFNPLK
jgi:hypothetical protein